MKADGFKSLADDFQAGARKKVVHVADAAGDGVLDRDHAQRRPTAFHRFKGVLKGGAGQRLIIWEEHPAGVVRVGPGLPLEGDARGHAPSSARARASAAIKS